MEKMDTLMQWNEQLRRNTERLMEKARRLRRLEELDNEIAKQTRLLEECRQRLNDEQEDVDNLGKASLPRVWYRLLGKLEERIEEEEKEAAEARLRYDASEAALRSLEAAKTEALRRLAEVDDAEEERLRILGEKKRWIHLFDPDTSRKLETLSEEAGRLRARRKEIAEALEAGGDAADRLYEAQEKLNSAKNWGTYDMLGGGMISTHIKHSRIEEARERMHGAQGALRRFEKELADLDWRSGAGDVEMGEFLTFADYFFDGFLTDWVVQGRISDALEKVDRGVAEVERQLTRLEQERDSVEERISETDGEYDRTLASR